MRCTATWESPAVVLVGVLLGPAAAASTLIGVTAGVSSIVGTRVVSIPWTLLWTMPVGATAVVAATSAVTALAATGQPAIEVARARE